MASTSSSSDDLPPAVPSSVPLRRILVGVDGSPGGQRAVAWARDVGAQPDLITTWRRSLAGRLLGATTYKVSHAAKTPVVVVPPDWQPAAA